MGTTSTGPWLANIAGMLFLVAVRTVEGTTRVFWFPRIPRILAKSGDPGGPPTESVALGLCQDRECRNRGRFDDDDLVAAMIAGRSR